MNTNFRPNREARKAILELAVRHPWVTLGLVVAAGFAIGTYYVIQQWPKKVEPPPIIGDGQPATIFFCS